MDDTAAEALLRKAPPADLSKNLECLCELLKCNSDAVASLKTKHYIPFKVLDSGAKGEKPFLLCQYNHTEAGKYRSPWTNVLHDAIQPRIKVTKEEDADKNDAARRPPPPKQTSSSILVRMDPASTKKEDTEEEKLRRLELTFNEVWGSYKSLYYGPESVGSVFLRETKDGSAFEGMFGIQKTTATGSWNSVSLVHVGEPGEELCNYKVETFLVVVLEPQLDDAGGDSCSTSTDISVTVSKAVVTECKLFPHKIPINVSHIENVGKLIEANEIDLRSSLEKVLIPKNEEILDVTLKKKRETRPQVNPLMGMVMNSDLLKKKLSKEAAGLLNGSEHVAAQAPPTTQPNDDTASAPAFKKKPPYGRPPGAAGGGMNPMAGMNPEFLKMKLNKTNSFSK